MQSELDTTFRNKNVMITGHTGFKGSWLTMWLQELGAKIVGYSIEPPTNPSLFEITELEKTITHHYGDVRDLPLLSKVIDDNKPEVIFHLAAQPLVLTSFEEPHETFNINAGGTVNLLEACRGKDFIQAIVIITTDKCYENKEWIWGYRENDPLGGDDPYSASKAMTEIAAASYRKSFFQQGTAIATARAGNVIGGGDFSDFRLIPDSMKALMNHKPIEVRNPNSVRPWLHVLDPLHGYLMLAKKLIECGQEYAEAWNFGPLEHEAIPASEMVERAIRFWGQGDWIDVSHPHAKPEMSTLKLNWDKAANRLKWKPTYNWKEALAETVTWYKLYHSLSQGMREACREQINSFSEHTTKMENNEIYSDTIEKSLSD